MPLDSEPRCLRVLLIGKKEFQHSWMMVGLTNYVMFDMVNDIYTCAHEALSRIDMRCLDSDYHEMLSKRSSYPDEQGSRLPNTKGVTA